MRHSSAGEDYKLVPGLALPAGWAAELRKLLDRISDADTVVNCLLAQERAEGVVQGFELAGAQDAATIERLYLLIDAAAQARLQPLVGDAG